MKSQGSKMNEMYWRELPRPATPPHARATRNVCRADPRPLPHSDQLDQDLQIVSPSAPLRSLLSTPLVISSAGRSTSYNLRPKPALMV